MIAFGVEPLDNLKFESESEFARVSRSGHPPKTKMADDEMITRLDVFLSITGRILLVKFISLSELTQALTVSHTGWLFWIE